MNEFKKVSFNDGEANYRELPVIDLGGVLRHARMGDSRTLERKAIERWENEGGEIPSEQRKRRRFAKG